MFNQSNKIPFLIILFLKGALFSFAQSINPGPDTLFMPCEVSSVFITMLENDKEYLLADENQNNEDYLPAKFRFKNSLIDTTLFHQVGIRLRGNTSRSHPKKSFKIKFKEYEGKKFYNQKKLNLKAENNDPSALREMMALRMFRDANVPAARSFHTRVYLNGEYMGHYLNVEQIDDEFAQTRFENDSGNLYKCHWGTTLEDDGQIYYEVQYELETNKDLNDRSKLANFVSVLNQTNDNNFKTEIEKVLNVDGVIKYFAVEAMVGHWDGYSYLKNNLYIYENPDNGLIEIIPYDVDNTFGIDWIGRDWAQRDLTDWAKHGEARPLYTRLLAIDEFREKYYSEINDLIENSFNEDLLFPEFDFYEGLLTSAIADDDYYPLTFGFNLTDYFNSFDIQVADHAPYGLKNYVATRIAIARQQVPFSDGVAQYKNASVSVYPSPTNGKFIYFRDNKKSNKESDFQVYNIDGKTLEFKLENEAGTKKIVFENILPAGIYILVSGLNREKFIVY